MDLGFVRRHFFEFVRGVLKGHPGVRIGRGVKLTGPGTYALMAGSEVAQGAEIWVGAGATLRLARGAKIGIRNVINVQSGLTIGSGSRMSWSVQVLDTDFHWIRDSSGRIPPVTRPVVISDDVLIGTGVIILKGVTIGAGAVVGAGSVVRRSVPGCTIVIGNPAQEVGQVTEWGPGAPPVRGIPTA